MDIMEIFDNIKLNKIVEIYDSIIEIDDTKIEAIDKWNEVRAHVNTNWNEEVELISQFKFHLDGLLLQLNDGTIEQMIIEEERNI